MAGKYYAVRVGKTPGIYRSWDACKAMVHGYPGAVYKSFAAQEDAEQFLRGDAPVGSGDMGLEKPERNVPGSEDAGLEKPGQRVKRGGRPGPEKPGQRVEGSGCAVPETPGRSEAAAEETRTGGGTAQPDRPGQPDVYAFVDGSYNAATKVYGYGGFLIHHGKKEILQGSGSEKEMASMRNVAGEILGSMAAIRRAVELGLPEVTVYYDYMGIEMWATGAWKRNKEGTIAYYNYICSVKDQIRIRFVKVKGHSGVDGNEEADALAKEAVGNR